MKAEFVARTGRRLSRIKIGYVVAFFFLFYLAIGVTRHLLFHSGGWDLGIFDQTIWQYSHLQIAYNSVRGVSLLLADHFHPVLMSFAALYWIWSSPIMLILAQAFLVAIAAFPIYRLAQRKLRNQSLALPIAFAYLGFWGILAAVAFDFHPIVLVVPLLAFAYYFLETDRQWAMLVMLALMLLVEEDAILMVIGFGIYLLAFRKKRRLGIAVCVVSAGWFVLVVSRIMPSLRPDSAGYAYWQHYSYIGPSMGSAALKLVTHPWLVIQYLFWPPGKLLTMFLLLLPFCFLPLLAPFSVVILPYFAERFLSDFPLHWSPYAHYNAAFSVVFAIAAIEALAWLERRGRLSERASPREPGRRFVLNPAHLATVFVIVALGAILLRGAWFAKENPLSSIETAESGYKVLAAIPADAFVVAQNAAVPHLSHRPDVYLYAGDYFRNEESCKTDYELYKLYNERDIVSEADYIVLNDRLDSFPLWPEEITQAVECLKQDGRFICHDYGQGWFLFERKPPPG